LKSEPNSGQQFVFKDNLNPQQQAGLCKTNNSSIAKKAMLTRFGQQCFTFKEGRFSGGNISALPGIPGYPAGQGAIFVCCREEAKGTTSTQAPSPSSRQ